MKATAVGVVTGLLAPVIVLATMSRSVSIMIDLAVILVAVGFSIGFGWTLWRARTKAMTAAEEANK